MSEKKKVTENLPRSKHFPTGGGPKPEVGPYSSLVLDVIREVSPAVNSIDFGVERLVIMV